MGSYLLLLCPFPGGHFHTHTHTHTRTRAHAHTRTHLRQLHFSLLPPSSVAIFCQRSFQDFASFTEHYETRRERSRAHFGNDSPEWIVFSSEGVWTPCQKGTGFDPHFHSLISGEDVFLCLLLDGPRRCWWSMNGSLQASPNESICMNGLWSLDIL